MENLLVDQKLIEVARRIDEVNPGQKEEVVTTGSDIFGHIAHLYHHRLAMQVALIL